MDSTAADSSADIERLLDQPFDRLSRDRRCRCFGVDYARLDLPEGELFLTGHAWPVARYLLPQQWFDGRHYVRAGRRLPGGTGAVYRVPTRPVDGRSMDIVVKFSRVGQDVPLEMATAIPEGIEEQDLLNARFNSPFEEFGLLEELRRGAFGPPGLRIRTHRPLAIYVSAQQYELWRLGRTRGRFLPHQLSLQHDQHGLDEPLAIELDIKRDYVLIYSWLKGENAEDCFLRGAIDEEQLLAMAPRVARELDAKGFRVLDNKPKHFILRRTRRDGDVLTRAETPVYGLVDFELLQRTGASQRSFQLARRAEYWAIQTRHEPDKPPPMPPALHLVNICDVDYVYGAAPNGGKLWTVGTNPELFDFFLPDRWRRTSRLKLSSINEVYRTRTRDNIYLVYRRSRVGEKPHVEPAYEYGRRILDQGFNSPFEEIAIAFALRRAGVPTVYPRAIYRTGHESLIANHLADRRRYDQFREVRLPDATDESVLDFRHDYYVIWGLWRGIDPLAAEHPDRPGVVDLQQARDEGLITAEQFDHLNYVASRRLAARGFADDIIDENRLLLTLGPDGLPRRDAGGEMPLTIAIDAQLAFERELLSEHDYRSLIERQHRRLLHAGFEPLDLHGDHLLLSADPDGVLHRDIAGELLVTHCNFDLIRRC